MSTALTLHYAPRTRSFIALWLLEELGLPYQLESFSLESGRHKQADYLALHPFGKVPLVLDGEVPVSEIGAIAIHLADRFPEQGFQVALDDPARPAYLRWHFFASAIVEPAYAQKFVGFEIAPSSAAWGSFEEMIRVATAGVKDSEWLLGDRFTLVDLHLAATLDFGMKFGIVPREGVLGGYVDRARARPSFARAEAIEAREGKRFPPQNQ